MGYSELTDFPTMPLDAIVRDALRSGVKIPAHQGFSPHAIAEAWWEENGLSGAVVVPEAQNVHVFTTDGRVRVVGRAEAQTIAGLAASVDHRALYDRFAKRSPRFLREEEPQCTRV